MPRKFEYDATIIGSGPNGLAAAITLAQAGRSVIVYEARDTVGGGMRSAELTLPGFTHDICSAIHPLCVSSPFFKALPLDKFGLEWIYPQAALAHPFDDGSAAILTRSLDATCKTLGEDAEAYKKLMEPFIRNWDALSTDLLAPLHFPKHLFTLMRFALLGIQSAYGLLQKRFISQHAKGLFAGLAAHSIMPIDKTITAAFGLILGILGHVTGWPIAKGGSQKIADALASYFYSLGGKIITGVNIENINDIPSSQITLCDITPRQLLHIAAHQLPLSYKRQLEKYRYGPGIFKIDWALNAPIPWKNKECLRAGTVHLGGTAQEILISEQEVEENKHPEKPFVLLAQQSLFDPTRAPDGKQTAWAYCHVPNSSTVNMKEKIEAQIERFAPGFRDCILARSEKNAMDLQHYNSNYIGGDINGGIQDIYQLFTRPAVRFVPYSTPVEGLYICSSSTPPGGGVHGLSGYFAAKAALKQCFHHKI